MNEMMEILLSMLGGKPIKDKLPRREWRRRRALRQQQRQSRRRNRRR